MGRHSQRSTASSNVAELKALVTRSQHTASSHSAEAAPKARKGGVSPMMYRAGGIAAALSIAVSGGAYAAVQSGGESAAPLTETQARIGALGADTAATAGPTASAGAGITVAGDSTTVTTKTEDTTEKYGTVKKETDSLDQGQTKVETKGVDGVTRTTYQVTTIDGKEVSKEAVSTVVVTAKVDEVVLVGTHVEETTTASTDSTSSAVATSGDPQTIARSMLSSYGWGDDQFSCLVSLWNRESSWDYTATNASSGAYGIPQALPGSKMTSAGSDWQTNPATQIKWGLGYISERYGSPCAAWAHSEATNWY
ncbi:G5 domain-containing protein [Actinomyces radicidentis]|uniref:G5 domain-containing protein n=1 Tax=Actinomyces radicidentis TaxID=111015 RepID=UPI0026DF5E8C|nr:G5 domain-containing protein [Actinomyces radicidentis]